VLLSRAAKFQHHESIGNLRVGVAPTELAVSLSTQAVSRVAIAAEELANLLDIPHEGFVQAA